MIIVLVFNPVYMTIQRIADRIILRNRYDYQKTIKDISNRLVTVLDYDKLILLIKETIIDVMKASAFTLLIYDNEKDEYNPAIQYGVDKSRVRSFNSSDPSIKIIKLANRDIYIEELIEDGDDSGLDEYATLFDELNAVLVVPMSYKGVLRGILCLGDKDTGEIYTEQDVELLQVLANQAVIALDNARLYEMAITDELTNLYIIRFFNQRIIDEIFSSIRSKRHLSLLMIDLDHFKAVNDTHGHQVGDMILKETAEIIEEQVRAIDLVARYGGEEFAVILTETNNDMAYMIAERIREKIESHEFIKGISKTVSIGISTIDGGVTSPAVESSLNLSMMERKRFFLEIKETFLYHADKALYRAKQNGRNRTENNKVLKI